MNRCSTFSVSRTVRPRCRVGRGALSFWHTRSEAADYVVLLFIVPVDTVSCCSRDPVRYQMSPQPRQATRRQWQSHTIKRAASSSCAHDALGVHAWPRPRPLPPSEIAPLLVRKIPARRCGPHASIPPRARRRRRLCGGHPHEIMAGERRRVPSAAGPCPSSGAGRQSRATVFGGGGTHGGGHGPRPRGDPTPSVAEGHGAEESALCVAGIGRPGQRRRTSCDGVRSRVGGRGERGESPAARPHGATFRGYCAASNGDGRAWGPNRVRPGA